MLTYGGGGKPIGTEHENFGIGAKVTLLPWNPAGLLVISYKDGQRVRDADAWRGARLRREAWEAEDDDGEYRAPPSSTLMVRHYRRLRHPGHRRDLAAGSVLGRPDGAARARNDLRAPRPEREYDTDPRRPGPSERGRHLHAAVVPELAAVGRWREPAVTIDVPVSTDKTTGPGATQARFQRVPEPADSRGGASPARGSTSTAAVATPVTQRRSVDLERRDARAHWWLRDAVPERRPNPYGPRAGFIAVRYRRRAVRRRPLRGRALAVPPVRNSRPPR